MTARLVGIRGAFVLCLLLLVNVLNFVDRLLPSVLVEAIRRDLHLKDTRLASSRLGVRGHLFVCECRYCAHRRSLESAPGDRPLSRRMEFRHRNQRRCAELLQLFLARAGVAAARRAARRQRMPSSRVAIRATDDP